MTTRPWVRSAPSTTILYASPNGEDILGMSPEEREGRSAFQWVHRYDISAAGRSFQALLAEPESTASAEFRYRHPERGWICIEGVGMNLLDEAAVGGIVLNCREVTRERELEEELAPRLRLDTIGALTAGIAHDLDNLLAVVTANAELIRDALRPDAVRDLEDLQVAVRGGAELIRSLMTFSRRSEPNLRPVDLAGVVTQAVRMLRRILPSRIQVEADVDADLPPARADSRALEQIILNLATDARDAMPRGGTLRIRVTSQELTPQEVLEELPAQHVGGAPDRADGASPELFLRMETSDTGIGMDQDTLIDAFQPFSSTKPEGQGTGLGLAMVSRIVQQFHGWITVESGVGEGTAFILHLPVAEGELEEPFPAPAADGAQMAWAGAGRRRRVETHRDASSRTSRVSGPFSGGRTRRPGAVEAVRGRNHRGPLGSGHAGDDRARAAERSPPLRGLHPLRAHDRSRTSRAAPARRGRRGACAPSQALEGGGAERSGAAIGVRCPEPQLPWVDPVTRGSQPLSLPACRSPSQTSPRKNEDQQDGDDRGDTDGDTSKPVLHERGHLRDQGSDLLHLLITETGRGGFHLVDVDPPGVSELLNPRLGEQVS
jgi:PAS domain S-box-containing protein